MLVRHVGIEEGDVVLDGPVEQLDVLGDKRHAVVQRGGQHLAKVGAGQPDHTVVRVVEPSEQLGDRRFAAPGPAQQTDVPAGCERQVEVFQDDGLVIAERDVVELHRQRSGRQVSLSRTIHQRGPGEQRPQPIQAGGRFLQLLHLVGDLLDGLLELVHVVQDQVGGSDRDGIAEDEKRAGSEGHE